MKKSTYSEELKADIRKLVELKKQTPRYKILATRHNVSEQTIRRLVMEATRGRTNVRIHVERTKVNINAIADEVRAHEG